MYYILLFIMGIIFAIIGTAMAENRNRSAAGGFFAGLFLGVIGLVIIALMGKAEVEED